MMSPKQRRWVKDMVEKIAREGIPAGHEPLVLITGRMVSPMTTRIGFAVSERLRADYDSLRALVTECLEAWIARHAAGDLPGRDEP